MRLLCPCHLLTLLEARDLHLNVLGLLLEHGYLTIDMLVLRVGRARHHATIRMHLHGQLFQWLMVHTLIMHTLVVHTLILHLFDQGAQL